MDDSSHVSVATVPLWVCDSETAVVEVLKYSSVCSTLSQVSTTSNTVVRVRGWLRWWREPLQLGIQRPVILVEIIRSLSHPQIWKLSPTNMQPLLLLLWLWCVLWVSSSFPSCSFPFSSHSPLFFETLPLMPLSVNNLHLSSNFNKHNKVFFNSIVPTSLTN